MILHIQFVTNGTYIVKIVAGENIYTRKLIIIK